jgi:hypothetical protein
MNLHLSILDTARKDILHLLKEFSSDGFYLAGGTGLALQIGHRDSIDFDFFMQGDFDTEVLVRKIIAVFASHTVLVTQQEKNTVSCLIDGSISLSFFGYAYDTCEPLVETEFFSIASLIDIGCMKCAAITSRSLEKDYVDLYFLLQIFSLETLLAHCTEKYPTLDTSLILKSLVYFDDVLAEPILFKEGNDVSFETVRIFLERLVKSYFA